MLIIRSIESWKISVTLQILDAIRHQVVEDVEAALVWRLEGDPGLLQKINFHVSSGQLAALVEVDPYELSLNNFRERGFIKFSILFILLTYSNIILCVVNK